MIGRAMRAWVREATMHKGLTTFLVLTLGISLGGGAFALSLNSAVLWRSLPFDNAKDLVAIEPLDGSGQKQWLSWSELTSIAASPAEPFASISGFTAADFNALAEPGLPPEALSATVVSPNFFATLRIGVALGGLPEANSYGASRERVVLLSHHFWQRRYRADTGIIGRSINLSRPDYLGGGDEPYRVIGVLERDAWLFWTKFDVVLPMQADFTRLTNPAAGLFERTVGRLANGASVTSARAAAPMLLEHIRNSGSQKSPRRLVVSDLQAATFADLIPQLTVVLWLAVMVFILAGTNVVIATIAHAMATCRHTAIRIAIGATRARLLGDALGSQAITIVIAALIGVVLAQWLVLAVGSQMPDGWISRIPGQLAALRVDRNVVAGMIAALAATLMCSAAAVHGVTRRLVPWSLLGSTVSDDQTRSRWRAVLVAVEIAICSAVVMTSATLVAQLLTLRSVTMGVNTTRTAAIWINLGSSALEDPPARIAYFDRLLEETESLPSVETVGGVSHPFNIGWGAIQFHEVSRNGSADGTALARAASTSYLSAAGIPLVEGRWFNDGDTMSASAVAVVSASLAHERWPRQSAIGQQIQTIDEDGSSLPATIIGVVGDVRSAPHLPFDRIIYRPLAQDPPPWLYLIVRSRQGAVDAISAVSDAVWRVNPNQPIDGPWTFDEWIDNRTSHLRFLTLTAIVLGVVGLVIAVAGVYSLTAWLVTSSQRSIAVRRAVGASDRQIMSLFLARLATVVVPGLVGGWLLQRASSAVLISAIAGLQPPSAASITAGVALIVIAVMCAGVIPLRRAVSAGMSSLLR